MTTAQLAERTGVAPGTLRIWQARHGFPVPLRLPTGRHRYTEADADAVLRLLELRAAGLSMAAAIARLSPPAASAQPLSIYAAIRAARPDLPAQRLTKRALLALTRAIEDQQYARAEPGVLIASFQREPHYRASERRWRQLAGTAALAVAFADFAHLSVREGAPCEVPLPRDHVLAREWTLIGVTPHAAACVAGLELPEPRDLPDPARRFEVVWSFEPAAVDHATRTAVALLQGAAPAIAAALPAWLFGRPAPSPTALRFGSELAARSLAYLASEVG
jgi:MerR family transcriptional regulator, light-induced transcriptional regulator